MDIFSQAGCRNTLIMKSKKALPGSHFSGFVSAIPGRIPSVVKAARATRADTVNLPHEESFQGKSMSPSGTTLSCVDAFRKWEKPRDSHCHLLSVLYTLKIYVMNKGKKYMQALEP